MKFKDPVEGISVLGILNSEEKDCAEENDGSGTRSEKNIENLTVLISQVKVEMEGYGLDVGRENALR